MRSRWHDMGRALKRAIFSKNRVSLTGHRFSVVYEARGAREDRDYPVLCELARGQRCIFDVGANMGLTSLLMASEMDRKGRIYAFEASEEACRIIKENTALNGFEGRIQVVNAVVWEKSGMTLDFFWDFASGGASTVEGYLGHRYSLSKVTLSLDDFVSQTDQAPDVVKVDVEGAEARVIAGMQRTMGAHRPAVMVELHSWKEMTVEQNAATILSLLRGMEYEMIYLRTKQAIEDVSVLRGRGRTHVLLWPKERPLPAWLSSTDTQRL